LQAGLHGEYDKEQLSSLLSEMLQGTEITVPEIQVDLPHIDVGELNIDFDMSMEPEYDESLDDEVPEVSEQEPIAQFGDIWLLGRHRVMCGDSTIEGDVSRLMDGQKAVLMNTDPPYGIDFVKLSQSKNQSKNYNVIENDDLINGKELQYFLEQIIKVAVPNLISNCPFYLWHPMLTQGTFFAAAAADIIVNRQIIWVKPSFVFGRGDYHWRHELCFYGWRKGNKPVFYGERNQSTIWELGRENDKIHPTQKPVELFVIPIKNHTKKNEICYEPFAGSGSQLIACEKTGRTCYGMEIDSHYVSVIILRWINYMVNAGKEKEIKIKCNNKDIDFKDLIENNG
jgi:DNA modification methylase